ncbi:MAG: plasmid pRiA4b ORF-3 family protein [Sphingomonas sp.]|uniref:plasmid pRiA4b ORF-3 family protein n=1 Tax=Sphingomonas sp. TaxID=28214 RepID=UPI0022769848|nr:plasmid pRiA4b ORF-3 family protein [Sphingomonas sp.]MCX8477113.1 plasmid pRiA4b ORF-3 family protein [Sphingomonas sp.]
MELDSAQLPRQHGGMIDQVARIRISLIDTAPEIWRRVDVPLEASLKMLHDIIQGAMGWMDYHLWEFEAGGKRYGLPDPEWPDDSLSAASTIKLKVLIDRGVRQLLYTYDMGDNWEHSITVEAVEDGQPGVKYPRYVDGARRAPPEDVGGMPGFENFVDAIADSGHPGHQEATSWHFDCYGNSFDPAGFDELAAKLRIGDIAK